MLVLSHLFPCFGQLPLSNSKSSAHHHSVLVAAICHAGSYQQCISDIGACIGIGFCLCRVNDMLVVLSTVT